MHHAGTIMVPCHNRRIFIIVQGHRIKDRKGPQVINIHKIHMCNDLYIYLKIIYDLKVCIKAYFSVYEMYLWRPGHLIKLKLNLSKNWQVQYLSMALILAARRWVQVYYNYIIVLDSWSFLTLFLYVAWIILNRLYIFSLCVFELYNFSICLHGVLLYLLYWEY